MPVDYKKGKIYTIRCYDDPSLIYVGSTCDTLWSRVGGHKRDSKTDNPVVSIVKLMKDKGEERFYIELYENFSCSSINELRKREGEVQRLIATVNKKIECRTRREHYLDNKERMAEYRQKNKEKKAEYTKKYRENNKEKIAEYYQNNKEKILDGRKKYRQDNEEKIAEKKKEYYENNKEKILDERKKYYENNKEKQLARMAEKITCDRCGIVICRHSLRRHQKSKKCEELSKNNICPIINDE